MPGPESSTWNTATWPKRSASTRAVTTPSNGATNQTSSPTLSWAAAAGATGYEYCIDATNDNACSTWISTGTNTSVGLSSLSAGATYYWQVRAVNGDGTTSANGGTWWRFTTVR